MAGTQNDLEFQPEAAIAADKNGRPLCVVGTGISKSGVFAFRPPGCVPSGDGGGTGVVCTGVRAIVVSLGIANPIIPDGSVLYSCDVAIAADAPPGDFPLINLNPGASAPSGEWLPTTGTDGVIMVENAVPTPTPTPIADGTRACEIVAPTQSRVAWLLLLPAVVLVWLRRRTF